MVRKLVSRIAGAMVALAMVAGLVVGTTSTALAADVRDFTLVNSIGATIRYVYVSPSDVTDWGNDVLGADVLLPGRRMNITFSRVRPGTCYYDIKVVTNVRTEGVLKSVNLCEMSTVTFH
jgi:hypothetical protein